MSEQRTLTRRRSYVSPLAGWDTSIKLPDGRTLDLGDEFTVAGIGRFRLKAIRPNGDLTAWGPIAANGTIPCGGMRSFHNDRVKTIHRKTRAIDARRAEEDN